MKDSEKAQNLSLKSKVSDTSTVVWPIHHAHVYEYNHITWAVIWQPLTCCLKGFENTYLSKCWLCHADEAQQGRNSCPLLSDTCPGDTVVHDIRTMMSKPHGWCNV